VTAEGAACIACELASGARPLPGGRIHETEHWLVEHCVGPLGVGTLIVKPRRHVVHVADLGAEEAAELGPLLHQASVVVSELCAPEQVYVCLWSHADAVPVHIHFVVQPATRAEMDAYAAHGPSLQVAMFADGPLPDPAAVDKFANAARQLFTST
jgi:diadenosine tetraphosphate (Ap4A) HIT family hydrolase